MVTEAQIPAPIHWSEQTVFEALRSHFVEAAVAFLPQVASETGAQPKRTADAIAMQLWPSRGLTIEGIEIKTDRRDLLREYAQPEKSDVIAAYCDKWWVATPPGVVKPSDFTDGTFPKTWGYLEVSVHEPGVLGLSEDGTSRVWLKPHTFMVKVKKKAEENAEVREPSRKFLASLLRNIQAFESPEAQVTRSLSIAKHKAERSAWDHAETMIAKSKNELDEIRRRVGRFENATGLRTGVFDSVWDDKQLDRTHEEQRRRLEIANSLDYHLEKAQTTASYLDSHLKNLQAESTALQALLNRKDIE